MKRHLGVACLAVCLALAPIQPVQALTVFDPSNYSQNVLQAARALQQITVTVTPELNKALQAYAELYRETYGEAEPVAALIPYMLESFLATDRGFAKARRDRSSPKRG